jgi:predicted nucleic acid-binding protein
MYLLDTNVVSELRKAETGKADKNVIAWAGSTSTTELFISAISILEIEKGVLQTERKDPTQGKVLRSWLDNQVIPAFSGRTLDVNTQVAIQCAKLHIPNPKSERDALIAATALVHSMTVVTRNTKDFEHTGVLLLNPWEYQQQ